MAAGTSLSCLIIDEHPVVASGDRALLEREIGGVDVRDAATPDAALAAHDGGAPDVVIIDPRSAGAEVGALVGRLSDALESADRRLHLRTAARGCWPRRSRRASRATCARTRRPRTWCARSAPRASGEFYVDPALSSTIVLEEGDRTLTARQREILQMLADGMQTEAVARQLGLSTETVRTHTKRILAKLHADTRTQAVAIAIRNGLIE